MKVKEVLSQVEEIIPKVKTFLDNTNGIIEALPTKRQLGLGVLGIGLIHFYILFTPPGDVIPITRDVYLTYIPIIHPPTVDALRIRV
ncbi:unnamed protein product [Prunus armeniaca]